MSTLTQSPAPSGQMYEPALLEFGDAELEAMRRFAAATYVLSDRPHDDPVGVAGWDVFFSIRDFYRARLVRLLPHQADLIRWVFDLETTEQGQLAAMGIPTPEVPPAPATSEDAAALARHERARKGGEAVVAKYGAAHMGAISNGRKPMPRYTQGKS